MERIKRLLSQVELFQTLPEDELEHLARTLSTVEVPESDFLFCEGDRGGHFYIVMDGRLEVIKATGTEEESIVGMPGPGDYFGEMSLLNPDGLRTASVKAVSQSRLLKMSREDFDTLLERQPILAYRMVCELSARLTNSQNDAIHELQEKNYQLQQAYEELKAAQAQLIEKEKIERELQLAREIQMSILPVILPELASFDFGALMVPARAVGGDFFGLIPLNEHQIAIVVGDVTDKGVPAAIFMAQTHALLSAEATRGGSPSETLQRVNNLLLGMNARGLFVTVLYGVLDRRTNCFDYVRAGHELPLLLSPSGDVSVLPMESGMPLGLFADPPLDEQRILIPPGGMLLIYSDGATDALDLQENPYKLDGLEASVRATLGMNGQTTCDMIFQAIHDFQQGTPQFDDITLVAIKALNE